MQTHRLQRIGRGIMDKNYGTINECLQMLKKSRMPGIEKLRVEIQLIRAKRFMLNGTSALAAADGMFEELAVLLGRVCGESCGEDDMSDLKEALDGLLTALGADPSPAVEASQGSVILNWCNARGSQPRGDGHGV